ncbi:MAG: hypothetical protein GQ582_06180 [Methyloprofundus sp.]|nr:hypothetical protein [Methyloprofundus sp.]
MNQLKCNNIQAGDVMLKIYDGSIFSRVISLGQMGQVNSKVVHAGLMFDSNYIIEAQGSGISANDIRVQNKQVAYIMYRPINSFMAKGAGTCAKMLFDIQHQHGSIKYNLLGTIMTRFGRSGKAKTPQDMDELLDNVLAGKQSRMFCSQFVVYVYQFVAEQCGISANQVFGISDDKASPSALASILQYNPAFQEVGYMISNER